MSLLRLTLTRRLLPRTTSPLTLSRPLTTTPSHLHSRKNTQDRDSLDPSATEYSKSGTDDEAASMKQAAFDPNETRPEEETKTAGKGQEGNPLEVSPGNKEISKGRGGEEGGAQGAPEKERSGGGKSG
ncbi:hypothetical protein P154DRAFT_524008 [Amniculicola lignicola CBS 123094]|uniref:Uncharacterized protein n=1 Tax=Amniculicola lignicola CBS 123094 TaxID=1392246 RepID=A0A6A5WCA2_9PLEO|nr:hypothetical protein P154DRAFT_524008 [Amniculicola lignicola CBS 123094]